MAMPSSYKSNHSNQFRLDTPTTRNTKLSDIVADLYGTWEATPPEIRYKMTGSDRALREAVASGALNPDGSVNDGEYGAYTSWKESNPDGTYNDFKKAKEAEDLIKMNNRALAAKGEYKPEGTEEQPKGEAPETTPERDNYIADQFIAANDEGGRTSRDLYDWEKPEGLPSMKGYTETRGEGWSEPVEDTIPLNDYIATDADVQLKYGDNYGKGADSPYANPDLYNEANDYYDDGPNDPSVSMEEKDDWEEFKKARSHR